MKRSRRWKLFAFGLILTIAGFLCLGNYNTPVIRESVIEVNATDNSSKAGSYLWNVTASFAKGDIICGLVLEPQYKEPGWFLCLEPTGDVPPYGYVEYPYIFVYLYLYNEHGDLVYPFIEMVWVNNPEAKEPVKFHFYIYNMTYMYNENSTNQYSPVDVVPGTSWIVLTPEGAPNNGVYTLKVSAFGARAPPVDDPPVRIALGKKLGTSDYPYTFLLPIGICLVASGGVSILIAGFPRIIERRSKRTIKSKKSR
jgi:hypothetical protein